MLQPIPPTCFVYRSIDVARDESLVGSSWFWLLEASELAGAVACETSLLAGLSYGSSGGKCSAKQNLAITQTNTRKIF